MSLGMKMYFGSILLLSMGIIFNVKGVFAQQFRNGIQPTSVQPLNLSSNESSSSSTYHHRFRVIEPSPSEEEECEVKFKPRHMKGIVNYFPANCL